MKRKLKNIRDFKIKKTPASVFPHDTKMQSDMDKKKKKKGGIKYKKGGFPDNNKDGEITQADIFLQKKKTGTIKKHGGVHKKKKKTMYKSGGFIEAPIINIDDI